MTKGKGTLFSFGASGRLGPDIVLTQHGQTTILRKYKPPTDAKSPGQLDQRLTFQDCVTDWHLLSPAEKEVYRLVNPSIGTNAAYLNFMKECLLMALAPHAPTHEDGGSDEVDVAGLSGLLADAQHVLEAEVNALIAIHAAISAAHHASPGALDVTIAEWRANAATGTFASFPQRINDNNTGTQAAANAEGQYAEVDLGLIRGISGFRHFGQIDNTGEGRWKLQYWSMATHAWIDWVLEIPVRTTADWSGWDSSGGDIIGSKVRLVCTTVDGSTFNRIMQLEVRYA